MNELENVEQLFLKAQGYNPTAVETFFETFWQFNRRLPKKESNELAERVYAWAQKGSASHYRVLCLAEYTLGVMAWRDERYEESLPYIVKAQGMFASINDEDGIAYCSLMLGATYRSLGDVELGLKYALEANEQLLKSGKYQFYMCISCYQLGEMYAATKHHEEALKMHEKAIELSADVGDPIIKALSQDGIAGVYLQQRKYDLVMKYLEEALATTNEGNFMDFKARVLNDMGVYYRETGNFEKALDYLNQAHTIREKVNAFGGMVTDMLQMAGIYEQQGKLDEAINTLQKALKIAEDIKVKMKMFPIHEMLSRIYQAKGDNEKSLAHYKQFHELREEVEHVDAEKKVKNMQLIFEAEQTKKENTIIKAQKKEIEIKNVELQLTIDELTRTKASRKAKAITLGVAVTLFILEEIIIEFVVHPLLPRDNFLISLGANGVIVFCIKPIERTIEHYLLYRKHKPVVA
jgi:tetratricopeptide (TPR) repeat protein